MNSPLETQPPVLLNRFIINLRSLNSPDSSQDSSAQQYLSRFSPPNFHVPDSRSFLGNIGEDLQDGHEPANTDLDDHHETSAVCLNAEGSLEAELKETSTTLGSSGSHPMDVQVSLQIQLVSKRFERMPFHLGRSPEQSLGLRKTS